MPVPPKLSKRQKELAREERRLVKAAKRAERKAAKLAQPPRKEGDPDPSIEMWPEGHPPSHPPAQG